MSWGLDKAEFCCFFLLLLLGGFSVGAWIYGWVGVDMLKSIGGKGSSKWTVMGC